MPCLSVHLLLHRCRCSKDLVQKLLTMNPKLRFTVYEALQHPWIVNEGEILDGNSPKIVGKSRLRYLYAGVYVGCSTWLSLLLQPA